MVYRQADFGRNQATVICVLLEYSCVIISGVCVVTRFWCCVDPICRLCYDCMDMNDNTIKRTVNLEGLEYIRTQVSNVEGLTTFATTCDEASGYLHHSINAESQPFWGFALFGHLFVFTHIAFG